MLKMEEPKNRKDLAARNYFKNEIPFADLFNVFLYHGEQVLEPRNLMPLDIAEITEKEKIMLEKRRDIIKLLEVKTDGKQTYMILGLECQSKIDWRMAVRMMMYDAMRYDEQIKRKLKRSELRPVISAVINLSQEKWRGPKSIKEIFCDIDPKLSPYISDYKMNLIDPHAMSEEEVMRYRSDLRTLMILLKYSQNEKEIKRVIKDKQWMQEASREAVIFSNVYFGIDIEEEYEKEEKIEMKHALAMVIEEEGKKARIKGLREGREEGREEGKREGHKEGIMEGICEGKKEATLQMAKRMIADGLSEDFIAKYADLSIKAIQKLKQEEEITV